ncbi:hypothetical protein BFP97_11200 [Roseivirga sp. 4D4]|uniref:hypothetical protein n=1 Tax=Roseivirga sp. 4D4 TaxID=1889784 RepID=UPI000852F1E8|nr:hypothetical protein [Roseivirga sp. 4D4]OEK02052.1 hypothetical protein BFP97_11200 [Roseivirga sp. 4D4]
MLFLRSLFIAVLFGWINLHHGFAQITCESLNASINTGFAEDSPSISNDGKALIFLRSKSDDWPSSIYKHAYWASLETNEVQKLTSFGDSLYTISFGKDDRTILFSKRIVHQDGDQIVLYRAELDSGIWKTINLTERYGLKGSYAHEVADGSLYFYDFEGEKGSGIYRAQFLNPGFNEPQWQGDNISTKGTTAFDAWVAKHESWMIYSKYFEDTTEEMKSGFYHARKNDNGWQSARIDILPYGWGASLSMKSGYFYFTDGDDILQCPISSLNLPFGN